MPGCLAQVALRKCGYPYIGQKAQGLGSQLVSSLGCGPNQNSFSARIIKDDETFPSSSVLCFIPDFIISLYFVCMFVPISVCMDTCGGQSTISWS